MAAGADNLGFNAVANNLIGAANKVQSDTLDFAEDIYKAASSTTATTDVALPGKGTTDVDGDDKIELPVDISTAAGAMAVSLWLEEKSNTVQSVSEVAAEQKKEVNKVNQTVG